MRSPIGSGLPERFWAKVVLVDDCWTWTAHRIRGYGRFMLDKKARAAHRLAYMDAKGAIPEGLEIDHLCRNRACVNPDHLEAVTRQVNVRRGLAPAVASTLMSDFNRARAARRTACNRGHAYTPESVRIRRDGSRKCLTCEREYHRTYRAKRAESWA